MGGKHLRRFPFVEIGVEVFGDDAPRGPRQLAVLVGELHRVFLSP
ncbi:Uncharacterised protein [Bordetella pertussis]|nr:Uncharacterised protein [Bordetella pertussis]CFW31513.1 Uncharacterised protein [Bordetella pertussis]